jgi:hypothetical protein
MNRKRRRRTSRALTAEVASIGRETHNWDVRIRVRAFWVATVVVLASSIAANTFADLHSSATAMACCAKTHGHCAGLNTPDNCCKRMGHIGPGVSAGTLSAAPSPVAPAVGTVTRLSANLSSAYSSPSSGFGFKRPHDPPHLHSFSLLI